MARVGLMQPASSGGPRRHPLLLAAAAAATLAACQLTLVPRNFVAPSTSQYAAPATFSAMAGVTSFDASVDSSAPTVAMEATTNVMVPWKGSSKFKTYDGFVYKRKRIPGVRLRLDRYGTSHWPFYKIRAAFQKRQKNRSGRFLEALGYFDPMKEVDDPRFFKLRADRAVFWLRQGAQPTDMVANLLDRAGILRRTGPIAKMGEWEWRIPKNSGPEAPEGWEYDGPHEVSWGNKPCIHHRSGHPHNSKSIEKIPLIERYGFKGYEKLPIEGDVLTEPVDGSFLLHQLDNTDIPVITG